MTICTECPAPAAGILTDCCDYYMGVAVCESHREYLTCPCCDTEWEPLP